MHQSYSRSGPCRESGTGLSALVSRGGVSDGIAAKLDPTGSTLLYSTYVGGSGSDGLHGIALDATGTIYAGFSTYSANFPVTAGAFQTVFGGTNDAGVLKLNPTGTGLVYSTYLGGPGGEDPARIAIDGSGNAYLLGRVYSGGFPTTPNALQPTYPGGNAVFLAKLNASGSTLLYSSYVGGSGDSRPTGIAVDSQSNVYVAMGTDATNAPTVNALQPTKHDDISNARSL